MSEGSTSRATETLVAKLNAASRDIYHVLHDTVPKELEESYRKGNAQTYTHNLFNNRGRKLMEQSRKAYRDDKQVRTRMDGFHATVRAPARHGSHVRCGRGTG